MTSLADYINTAIINHLTDNIANLAVDNRTVSIHPLVVTEAYKEVYPTVLVDAPYLTSYEPMIYNGGWHIFEVPIICLDKTNSTQEDDKASRIRVESLSHNVARTLGGLNFKYPNSINFEFDGEVVETGNKIKNAGLTASIRLLVVC